MNRRAFILGGAGVAIAAPFSSSASLEVRFTDELWTANLDIYRAILRHPFITGLVDGSLPKDAFAFYMMQDAHYLREFSRALRVVADKAPDPGWATTLRRHASESSAAELQLHESVFKEYGISKAKVEAHEPAPEALAYMDFMLAVAHAQPFGEGLAGLLPCYWIYLEVGRELRRKGSRNAVYQRWIEAYSSETYENDVKAVREIVDTLAQRASSDGRARMMANFRRAARYEWMFWDSAYAQRTWPSAIR